jgi:VanZ family protein
MKQEPRPFAPLRLGIWGPVMLWIALIWTMSGEPFAAKHTGNLLAAGLRFVFPDIGLDTLQMIHGILRKVAHLTEYAVLGGLGCNAFGRQQPDWSCVRRVLVSLAVAVSCALVDEGHQKLDPDRTGSLYDVLLDTAGAALGAGVVMRSGGVRVGPESEPGRTCDTED